MKIFTGIAASPGIAVGRLKTVDRHRLQVTEKPLEQDSLTNEITRLENAIHDVRSELTRLKQELSSSTDEEHLFFIDTHLLILADERLFHETVETITSRHINAESALKLTLLNFQKSFAAIEDEYLRERITDVETVVEKILHSMLGTAPEAIEATDMVTIIAAHDFPPSDILQLDRKRVIGLLSEIGGKTSHSSILARAFELPYLAGVQDIANKQYDGCSIIIDGLSGIVVIDPDENTFREYLQRKHRYELKEESLRKQANLPACTIDGRTIHIKGNVEVPQECSSVLLNGGDGIGLYRTEMLFMNRQTLPDEDEQFQEYRTMQMAIAPMPLTIRTIDAGGDKLLDGLLHSPEQNPALGMRAIRLALTMPDEFKNQLRAILRVSAFGKVRVMFPMISGVEELRESKRLLDECKKELEEREVNFDKNISLGIMVEIPSAVTIADLLAKEVNFFSVGTNDLIQYTLALDRANEQLTSMYQPLHPAVLRSLARITSIAHEAHIDACICGEMAGDPSYLPILLGLGFDELSMGAASIPRVKQFLRRCSFSRAEEIAKKALTFSTAAEVEAYLAQEITSHFAESID